MWIRSHPATLESHCLRRKDTHDTHPRWRQLENVITKCNQASVCTRSIAQYLSSQYTFLIFESIIYFLFLFIPPDPPVYFLYFKLLGCNYSKISFLINVHVYGVGVHMSHCECEGQRTTLGLFLTLRGPQVTRLVQRMPLPSRPSCQSSCFLFTEFITPLYILKINH